MSYLDAYKARLTHLGTTYQERALESGKLEFRRYLKYSQQTQHNLINEFNNYVFSGVILTDKEDENRVSQVLLVECEVPIELGNLILWNDEHWIVYQKERSSYEPHQKFYMVRCNYFIKWVDKNGQLKQSWCYLVGTKDSKIKDNFRTWHSLITPQPNKNIEIMMPHQMMELNTEIMVLDETWYLVDYDQNSVPGIIYLSFYETNVNEQRDDLENKIANADQIAEWSIELAAEQTVEPNSVFSIFYTVSKNGISQEVVPQISVSDGLTLLDDGRIQAGESNGVITVSYNGITKTQTVKIGAQQKIEPILIGNEKIRATESTTYVLENAPTAEFSISNSSLAIMKVDGNKCEITANSNNKVGTFTLAAEYDGKTYTKQIKVVSLWQVI